MDNSKNNLNNEKQIMFEPQENNPEKMLPPGHSNVLRAILTIILLNIFVFAASYGIVYLLIRQSAKISLVASEGITALSLIIIISYWVINRNKYNG